MARLEEVATAAANRDALGLRAALQDLLEQSPDVTSWPRPHLSAHRQLALAAALAELVAQRRGMDPPAWTSDVGPCEEPLFLLASAERLPRLRRLCLDESPEPLKKRLLYATPNFLEFA